MDLGDYQKRVSATDERKNMLISLAGLVSEVGSIASAYKNRRLLARHIPTFNRELAEELGDTLWYLASVANAAELSLNEIASANLKKARWFSDKGEATKFDKRYPPDERFPRVFQVSFTEKKLNSNVLVRISTEGVIIGDHLTDNSYDPDGYRYHDVFHLAYAAILGWSPVVRALLKRKRKSRPRIDEIEDGARALAVEEALSIFIFNHAKQQNFFVEPNSIGLSLLRKVQDITGGLEVKDCTAKQWKAAIERGYDVFRELRSHKGGDVTVDLDNRDITYGLPRRLSNRAKKDGRNQRTQRG